MAVTTTTTLTELVNSEFINRAVLEYALDFIVIAPFLNMLDLRGKATSVGSFPRWNSPPDAHTDLGTSAAAGGSAETTDLTSSTLQTTQVSITAAEVGIRRDVTDISVEDNVLGSSVFDFIVKDAGSALAVSLDDDVSGLHGSLSNTVGTTTQDLTLANMVEAMAKLRRGKMRGQAVYVLGLQQAQDLQAAQAAATATTIGSFMTIEANNSNYLGTFMGAPVWCSSTTDFMNSSNDEAGCLIIRGDTNPTSACYGMVLSRDVRVERDRDIHNRTTLVVATARWGVGEINDDAGVVIHTGKN